MLNVVSLVPIYFNSFFLFYVCGLKRQQSLRRFFERLYSSNSVDRKHVTRQCPSLLNVTMTALPFRSTGWCSWQKRDGVWPSRQMARLLFTRQPEENGDLPEQPTLSRQKRRRTKNTAAMTDLWFNELFINRDVLSSVSPRYGIRGTNSDTNI